MRIWRATSLRRATNVMDNESIRRREWEQQRLGRFIRWHQAFHYTDQYSHVSIKYLNIPYKISLVCAMHYLFTTPLRTAVVFIISI